MSDTARRLKKQAANSDASVSSDGGESLIPIFVRELTSQNPRDMLIYVVVTALVRDLLYGVARAVQWDRFQSEDELREVITLFWRGIELTDMDEYLVDGPRTERIAMEVAIDAPDIQDAELLLVRHYQHDPDQTRALLLVGDKSGLARAVFGSHWRWELIKICVDHLNAMFAEYAVMVNQAVDSDKRSPFYIAEKYGRGRRGEKQRLRTAARGYLAVLTVVGTGRLVLPEPIRSNLEDLEFERTLLDHHMISKYRKRKAKAALAAGPSDSVGLSDATSDQNSTSFSDGEIPFSNLSDDSLLTSSDVSPESFESELSARVRIDLSSDSTAASSSSVAVMSGSDEDKEMRNPAVVYVESSVTAQRDLKAHGLFEREGDAMWPLTTHDVAAPHVNDLVELTMEPVPMIDHEHPPVDSALSGSALLALPDEVLAHVLMRLDRPTLRACLVVCWKLHVMAKWELEARRDVSGTILSLPDEILVESVFGRLGLADLAACRLVSRRFCVLSSDRSLYGRQVTVSLQPADVSSVADEPFLYLVGAPHVMEAMTWLTIRGTDDVDWSSLNVRCLDTLLRSAPRMTTLDISNTMRVRESHVETFPVWLQRLNLARCLSHHDSDEAIVALGRLMNLKAVSLREASCGGAIPFHAWHDLRRIDLRGVDGIHIEEVAEALASAPFADRLEAANLRLATGASGAWFEVLPQLTALRELSFQIGSVDLDALIGVLGSCLLTKVDIWSNRRPWGAVVECLQAVVSLHVHQGEGPGDGVAWPKTLRHLEVSVVRRFDVGQLIESLGVASRDPVTGEVVVGGDEPGLRSLTVDEFSKSSITALVEAAEEGKVLEVWAKPRKSRAKLVEAGQILRAHHVEVEWIASDDDDGTVVGE